MLLVGIGVRYFQLCAERLAMRARRVVAKLLVMKIKIYSVEAETIDTPVQPKFRHIKSGILDLRVVKIQVRLFFQKVMQVILSLSSGYGP